MLAENINLNNFTSNSDIKHAPEFTLGYDLPDGWKWACYDDGSGCLNAPNGERYYIYDFATGEVSNSSGRFVPIADGDWIKDDYFNYVLPAYIKKLELLQKCPDIFKAYGVHSKRVVKLPNGFKRVAISPELIMEAKEFNQLLQAAQVAENRYFRDGTIDVYEFACRLSASYPKALYYEGEIFTATTIKPKQN